MQTQNKLFEDYLTAQTNDSSTKYKKYRNKLTQVKEIAKKMFYQNKFNDYKTNISATWQNLNKLMQKSQPNIVPQK